MDIRSIIVVIVVVAANIIAWVITYCRLNERVDNMKDTLDGGKTGKDGLCEKVDGISRHVANLEGTLTTFMDFMRNNRG
jgi:cell division protein FtsL